MKTLMALATEIRQINQNNGWKPLTLEDWDAAYKIPASLALLHSEIDEAAEWVGSESTVAASLLDAHKKISHCLELWRHSEKAEFLEELADVQIRLLDLAGGLTDDFDAAVQAKLDKNRRRGHKHGGKRL